MTKVQITGGYTGEVTGRLRDRPEGRTPADLSAANVKVCLVPVGGALPAKASPLWVTPTSVLYPEAGLALVTLSLSLAAGHTVGRYYLYALASVSPLSVPVKATNEVVELV